MSERLAKVTTAAELRAEILADTLIEEDIIRAAETEHRAALAQLDREVAELRAAHDEAAAIARREYAAAPPPPELPDGAPYRTALHELLRARQALVPRRSEALANALPQVAQAWDAARAPLDDQAREIAAQATQLAEAYASWHRLLSEARRAVETSNPNERILHGPSTRMRPRPGPHDIIDAALGADLCAPGPSDAAVHAMLVTGKLDDGSGRVIVGG